MNGWIGGMRREVIQGPVPKPATSSPSNGKSALALQTHTHVSMEYTAINC